jgi:hypothetical protein
MTVCCLCSQTGQSLVFVGFVQVLFDILFTGFLSCTGDAGYAQASHVRPMDESWCMWHRWCTLPKESFVSGKDNASARGNPVGGPKFGRVVFERPHVLHLVMLSGSVIPIGVGTWGSATTGDKLPGIGLHNHRRSLSGHFKSVDAASCDAFPPSLVRAPGGRCPFLWPSAFLLKSRYCSSVGAHPLSTVRSPGRIAMQTCDARGAHWVQVCKLAASVWRPFIC